MARARAHEGSWADKTPSIKTKAFLHQSSLTIVQVFGNWAQFRLTLHYLSTMNNEQTLSIASGHPSGKVDSTAHLYPKHPNPNDSGV